MKQKKEPRQPQKRGKKGKENDSSKSEKIVHYNAILIEDLKSDFKFVIEGLEGLKRELAQKIEDNKVQQEADSDIIKSVLKHHSSLLQHIEDKLKQHDVHFDQIENKLKQHDARFDQIDGKLDRVADKVDQHDQDIKELKTTAGFSH